MIGKEKKYIFLLLIGLLILGACQKSYDTINILEVKPEFEFSLKEKYDEDSGSRIGFLRVQMNSEISCDKVQFISKLSIEENEIIYDLHSINRPEVCKDTTIVPYEEIPLRNLKEQSYYTTILISDAYEFKGQLLNNKDFFYLSIPDNYEEQDRYEVIYKVPQEIAWGRISFENNEDLKAVNNFIEKIHKQFPTPSLSEGKYTPFIIKAGEVKLNNSEYPAQSQFNRSFLASIKSKNDEQLLHEFIHDFNSSNHEKLHLEIYSWSGKQL